ncbi:MAG: hypothetical protein HYT08_01015 [Candidatus Levybacteria bacterium]|nr:hypothetical protein [Candidatus Levybacteria bacterium]
MKKRKNKGKYLLFKILFAVLIFISITSFFYILYLSFIKKPVVISPLGKKSVAKTQVISETLSKKQIPFASVETASDSSYLVNLSDGGQVIISSSKDIEIQISSLQLILKRLTIEGKRLKKLDFRFEKPVLSF